MHVCENYQTGQRFICNDRTVIRRFSNLFAFAISGSLLLSFGREGDIQNLSMVLYSDVLNGEVCGKWNAFASINDEERVSREVIR